MCVCVPSARGKACALVAPPAPPTRAPVHLNYSQIHRPSLLRLPLPPARAVPSPYRCRRPAPTRTGPQARLRIRAPGGFERRTEAAARTRVGAGSTGSGARALRRREHALRAAGRRGELTHGPRVGRAQPSSCNIRGLHGAAVQGARGEAHRRWAAGHDATAQRRAECVCRSHRASVHRAAAHR